MPQPNFVPVMPSTSRKTHRSGVSPSTSTLCVLPLILIVKAMVCSPCLAGISAFTQFDHGFGKGLRSFLGQIVTNTAHYHAVRISAREFLGIGARVRMRGTVR